MIEQSMPVNEQSSRELDALWTHYKNSGDLELKNELVLRYMGLVKRIVRRMMPKYNSYNEYDDLINCGIIGLISAIEKYDLNHGVKFETYAVTRIRGEILDYMRSQDWAPSSLRKKINSITAAYEDLESERGVAPTEQMVAEKLDMRPDQIQKIMAQTHIFNLVNFEDVISGTAVIGEVAGPESEIPENILVEKDMKAILVEMIDTLPEKERLVITLYYYEELMLKEIADILEVSESRISQIHSKVIAKLRAKLENII